MKILFCSPVPLKETLGTARTLLDISNEFRNLGWEVKMISPEDIVPNYQFGDDFVEELRTYLLQHAAEYDVVEYDHSYLPYPRKEFSSSTLFVARSQLLAHHFGTIQIPPEKHWRSQVSCLIRYVSELRKEQASLERPNVTIAESDLTVVLNQADQDMLRKYNFDPAKVFVIPNGMSLSDRKRFDNISSNAPIMPKIAFVGSFFPRKGSADFPAILQYIFDQIPGISFRLLGTSRSAKRVHATLPREIRRYTEVYPHFAPENLPALLEPCSVGIFPSYIEGFPLSVLEMLAASIPVIAYDAPGPPMMLDSHYLVPMGDTIGMAQKVVDLLQDDDQLSRARVWAKQRSKDFCWQQIARQTSEIYLENWQKKQTATPN
jgi:glycosyltransferase involved in cell wall biosynthesis